MLCHSAESLPSGKARVTRNSVARASLTRRSATSHDSLAFLGLPLGDHLRLFLTTGFRGPSWGASQTAKIDQSGMMHAKGVQLSNLSRNFG